PTRGAALDHREQSFVPCGCRPGRGCPAETNCTRAHNVPPGVAPHPGRVAQSGGIARPTLSPSDVLLVPYKRTTGSTGPGHVLASRRSVGTTHGHACRPGRLLGPRILWLPLMLVPEWLRSRTRAECAAVCLGARRAT